MNLPPKPRDKSFRRIAFSAIFAIMIVTLANGCNSSGDDANKPSQDPSRPVDFFKIKILGKREPGQREEIDKEIKAALGEMHYGSGSAWGDEEFELEFNLLNDQIVMEEFAKNITFGKVTKIEGDTIYVELVESADSR